MTKINPLVYQNMELNTPVKMFVVQAA